MEPKQPPEEENPYKVTPQEMQEFEGMSMEEILTRLAPQLAQTKCTHSLLFLLADVVILAGAGMSVDSGIPDYRGADGF